MNPQNNYSGVFQKGNIFCIGTKCTIYNLYLTIHAYFMNNGMKNKTGQAITFLVLINITEQLIKQQYPGLLLDSMDYQISTQFS